MRVLNLGRFSLWSHCKLQVGLYNWVPLEASKRKGRMFQLSLTNKEDRPTDTPVIPKSLRILHTFHTYIPKSSKTICPCPSTNPPKPYVPIQAPIYQNRPPYAPRPRLNLEARKARTYTPIAEPYA
ncbi:hypothetical protein H5410_030530 [Solanum commersonii]|uniref:Uncharacterized protein n=1 Tax=Solanum commersonii TaxID=4109 RepID=A0A9J5YHM9_SOLCO|nr:hypothetical protein H5410_030530 [Solanum commersonii]